MGWPHAEVGLDVIACVAFVLIESNALDNVSKPSRCEHASRTIATIGAHESNQDVAQ